MVDSSVVVDGLADSLADGSTDGLVLVGGSVLVGGLVLVTATASSATVGLGEADSVTAGGRSVVTVSTRFFEPF